MPETLISIVVTASSSSFRRRPMMKTYAPSLANSAAVASPIPSVPPVTTATLPSNLPTVVTPVGRGLGSADLRDPQAHELTALLSGRGPSPYADRRPAPRRARAP